MGDRRVGERREKEKGVIKFKIKDIIGYAILGAMLIVSLILNVILANQNANYKVELIESNSYINELEDYILNGDEEDDEEYEDENEEDELDSNEDDEEVYDENEV